MPIHPLPDNPDIDKLKGNAKLLRDLVRAGDTGTAELVRTNHPRGAEVLGPAFKLADAQLTLARHHGFASWPKLRQHVDLVRELTRSPHLVPLGDGPPEDELLELACLNYGADRNDGPVAARRLLAAHPELSGVNVWTAAACGDVAAVRAHAAQASREGGPFAWEPLLYLTYSRLGVGDAVATARVLLDHGADPNAGYLWDGLTSPFTALTGAYGGGEQGAPAHADELALAEVLLGAGADANDNQTIYNRGLGGAVADDTGYLEQLLRFGLGRGDGGPWKRRLGPAAPTPAELLGEALQAAVENGCVRRTTVLLAGGADPNGRGLHPLFGGRTAIEGAVRNGHREIVDLLVVAGGDLDSVDARSQLVGALLAGDRTAVAAATSEAVATLRDGEPGLVARAAELGHRAGIELLVELGWDVNAKRRETALHSAAWAGDVATIRTLLALGADPTIEDEEFHATPRGWALHNGQTEAATLLE